MAAEAWVLALDEGDRRSNDTEQENAAGEAQCARHTFSDG